MDTTKFHTEAAIATDSSVTGIETFIRPSQESQLAAIESIVLGLLVRGWLSEYDKSTIDALFPEQYRPFIIKETECLYPEPIDPSKLSLWIIIYQDQLATGDLGGHYPLLIEQIEKGWPELISAANRVKQVFDSGAETMLVNRSSGRIIAVSQSANNKNDSDGRDLVGCEFGSVEKRLLNLEDHKALQIDNFKAHEVHLSLVRLSSGIPSSKIESHKDDSAAQLSSSKLPTERLADGPMEINLHVSRFNSLLEHSFHSALPQRTLAWLESTIDQIVEHAEKQPPSQHYTINTNSFKACLRLMLQSILMSHRVTVGPTADTSMLVFYDNEHRLNLRFVTPIGPLTDTSESEDEWWQLAKELSQRIGFTSERSMIQSDSLVHNLILEVQGSHAR